MPCIHRYALSRLPCPVYATVVMFWVYFLLVATTNHYAITAKAIGQLRTAAAPVEVTAFTQPHHTHLPRSYNDRTMQSCMQYHADNYMGCLLCSMSSKLPELATDAGIAGNSSLKSSVVSNVSKAFTQIYDAEVWSSAGGGSGHGSSDMCGTTVRQILRLLLFKYQILSVIDAPCGAVHSSWMRSTIYLMRTDVPCFRYLGVDVVDSVVRKNAEAFQGLDWAAFRSVDLSSASSTLPQHYDLIHSRDALQHLSYAAIGGALRTYCASDAKYLLVGSYVEAAAGSNKDIEIGGAFEINLLAEPFSFPAPLETFAENKCGEFPLKHLLLYNLSSLCASESVRKFISLHAI